MPPSVLERFCEGLTGSGFSVRHTEENNKEGICIRVRIIAALHIISYGKRYHEMD